MDPESIITQLKMHLKRTESSTSIPFTAFHQCVVDGDITIVTAILSRMENLPCSSLLNCGVSYSQELLIRGYDAQLQQAKLPLVLAASSCNSEMMSLLLELGEQCRNHRLPW